MTPRALSRFAVQGFLGLADEAVVRSGMARLRMRHQEIQGPDSGAFSFSSAVTGETTDAFGLARKDAQSLGRRAGTVREVGQQRTL